MVKCSRRCWVDPLPVRSAPTGSPRLVNRHANFGCEVVKTAENYANESDSHDFPRFWSVFPTNGGVGADLDPFCPLTAPDRIQRFYPR